MNDFQAQIKADWFATAPTFLVLAGLMLLDVLGGLSVAFSTQKLSSTISRSGAAKKSGTLLLVLAALLIDGLVPTFETNLPYIGEKDMTLAMLMAGFFIVTEFISLTEKAAALKLPIPRRLKEALKKVRDEIDGEMPMPEKAVASLLQPDATEEREKATV
jgi:toxin secretion/phage lysis holin